MSKTARKHYHHFTIESICIVSAALTVGVDVWYVAKKLRAGKKS